ncbi:MarR family winged helix-turn-helix transcriptional regulator [uncultured Tateyamaria sp.]|uniref:MarR family winged helix-turn-helix transcriptional regulator n=1 Tax=uncultured Tateyamaria sp. TaxID=455651 RepID=UPI00262E8D2B|nr:MarR family transcriptional regulator [uncultured Tateyamaria sp.]
MEKREERSEVEVSDAALRDLVGYNMKRAFNVVQADLARTLEPFGLRMLTFSALSMIVENPGLRPSQLAGALSVERANVVVYVDQLEEAGWVTRAPSERDRRAYALQCTLAGRQVYDKARAAVRAHDRRMLDGLREVEIAAVKKALMRIEGLR